MNTSENKVRFKTFLIFGSVYLFVGIATAFISNDIASSGVQAFWRILAFAVSIIVFGLHIRLESIQRHNSPKIIAINTSFAVAFGTVALAVLANINAMLNSSGNNKSLVLAIVIWPVVTGLLSFLAAYFIARFILRLRSKS